jgi:hypothetical protein
MAGGIGWLLRRQRGRLLALSWRRWWRRRVGRGRSRAAHDTDADLVRLDLDLGESGLVEQRREFSDKVVIDGGLLVSVRIDCRNVFVSCLFWN